MSGLSRAAQAGARIAELKRLERNLSTAVAPRPAPLAPPVSTKNPIAQQQPIRIPLPQRIEEWQPTDVLPEGFEVPQQVPLFVRGSEKNRIYLDDADNPLPVERLPNGEEFLYPLPNGVTLVVDETGAVKYPAAKVVRMEPPARPVTDSAGKLLTPAEAARAGAEEYADLAGNIRNAAEGGTAPISVRRITEAMEGVPPGRLDDLLRAISEDPAIAKDTLAKVLGTRYLEQLAPDVAGEFPYYGAGMAGDPPLMGPRRTPEFMTEQENIAQLAEAARALQEGRRPELRDMPLAHLPQDELPRASDVERLKRIEEAQRSAARSPSQHFADEADVYEQMGLDPEGNTKIPRVLADTLEERERGVRIEEGTQDLIRQHSKLRAKVESAAERHATDLAAFEETHADALQQAAELAAEYKRATEANDTASATAAQQLMRESGLDVVVASYRDLLNDQARELGALQDGLRAWEDNHVGSAAGRSVTSSTADTVRSMVRRAAGRPDLSDKMGAVESLFSVAGPRRGPRPAIRMPVNPGGLDQYRIDIPRVDPVYDDAGNVLNAADVDAAAAARWKKATEFAAEVSEFSGSGVTPQQILDDVDAHGFSTLKAAEDAIRTQGMDAYYEPGSADRDVARDEIAKGIRARFAGQQPVPRMGSPEAARAPSTPIVIDVSDAPEAAKLDAAPAIKVGQSTGDVAPVDAAGQKPKRGRGGKKAVAAPQAQAATVDPMQATWDAMPLEQRVRVLGYENLGLGKKDLAELKAMPWSDLTDAERQMVAGASAPEAPAAPVSAVTASAPVAEPPKAGRGRRGRGAKQPVVEENGPKSEQVGIPDTEVDVKFGDPEGEFGPPRPPEAPEPGMRIGDPTGEFGPPRPPEAPEPGMRIGDPGGEYGPHAAPARPRTYVEWLAGTRNGRLAATGTAVGAAWTLNNMLKPPGNMRVDEAAASREQNRTAPVTTEDAALRALELMRAARERARYRGENRQLQTLQNFH